MRQSSANAAGRAFQLYPRLCRRRRCRPTSPFSVFRQCGSGVQVHCYRRFCPDVQAAAGRRCVPDRLQRKGRKAFVSCSGAERKNGLGYARGSSARRVAPAIHAIPFISRFGRRLRSLRSGRRFEATAFPGFREPGACAVRWRLSPAAHTRQPSADTTRSRASADIASVGPRRSVQNRSTGPANSNRHKELRSSNLALDSL